MPNQNYRYDVALSFAGEDRKYAEELAQVLKNRHNIGVFYDDYEKATLWGRNLYTGLSEVYKKQARFCIMFLSQHYAQKLWTNHEREAAQARAFQEKEEYILPIRLDNTEIPGILPTIGYLKWSNADSIADAIVKKLEQETPTNLPLVKPVTPQLPNNPPKQNQQYNYSDDDLSSERNVDYTQLRNLLAVGNWADADDETYSVMLKVVDRKEVDGIRDKDLWNFPCTDLRTIDSLWVKYSNGRFGFSVQKKIYLEVGGVADGEHYEEAWEKFGDRVGWRKGRWMKKEKEMEKEWINSSKVTFDTSAPMGHLPTSPFGPRCNLPVEFHGVVFRRIQACEL